MHFIRTYNNSSYSVCSLTAHILWVWRLEAATTLVNMPISRYLEVSSLYSFQPPFLYLFLSLSEYLLSKLHILQAHFHHLKFVFIISVGHGNGCQRSLDKTAANRYGVTFIRRITAACRSCELGIALPSRAFIEFIYFKFFIFKDNLLI